MLRVLPLLATLSLAGACTATPSQAPTQAIDGITVNCSGADSGWVFCYRTAAGVCGTAGYTIVKRDGAGAAPGVAGETRSMLIRCN